MNISYPKCPQPVFSLKGFNYSRNPDSIPQYEIQDWITYYNQKLRYAKHTDRSFYWLDKEARRNIEYKISMLTKRLRT